MNIKISRNMGISQEVLHIFSYDILSDRSRLMVQNARKIEANIVVGNCHVTTAPEFTGF